MVKKGRSELMHAKFELAKKPVVKKKAV